jgi:large subunit ribosomal protein L10e
MHGRNYRTPSGMPHTRKDFVPGTPNVKVARFSTGAMSPDYDLKLQLIGLGRVQIRHNALEAARVAANKKLTPVGETNYFLQLKVYPHVILRENKMIATAGADRLQEGMRKAFGKPTGLAARVDAGAVLMELFIRSAERARAEEALRGAASKLPVPTRILGVPLAPAVAPAAG